QGGAGLAAPGAAAASPPAHPQSAHCLGAAARDGADGADGVARGDAAAGSGGECLWLQWDERPCAGGGSPGGTAGGAGGGAAVASLEPVSPESGGVASAGGALCPASGGAASGGAGGCLFHGQCGAHAVCPPPGGRDRIHRTAA